MVLKTRPASGQLAFALQPLAYEIHPTSWGNRKSAGIWATFDLAAVTALPTRDIDVVTITAAGEARCKLSASTREHIE